MATEQLYFLGVPWDGTFVAACVAALVAAASWFFTHQQLKALNGQQAWFLRYQLALEQIQSRNNKVRLTGITMLTALSEARWATEEDRTITLETIALFEDRAKRR